MPFEIVAYDLIKANIQQSVDSLVRFHNGDPNKLNESIKKLPEERRIQATYLLKTIKLLDASTLKPDERARVLNAATYYVRDQIGDSYKWKSPEGSTFFNSLTTSLNLNKDNQPERNDLVKLYGPLETFMLSQVYKSGDPMQGHLADQPYTIKGFVVEDHILAINEKLFVWNKEIIIDSKVQHQKDLDSKKPVTASKGFLGGLWGSSTPAPTKSEPAGTTLGNAL